MRKLAPALAFAAVAAFAGTALAQTVVISPEQETVVKEYIVREQADPTPLVDFDLKVGSILPDTVEVRKLDVPDIDANVEYVYTDRGTVIVEPGTRKVIQVID